MKIFKITGKVKMGRNLQKFTREIISKNKKTVKEKIYCEFGSKHRANRRNIHIDLIEEITKKEVKNSIVKGELND